MKDLDKIADQVVDLAERFADVTDAAQGRGVRKRMGARWLLFPAAGVGLYALGASRSFTSQAKNVMTQAKARASDLPEELIGRVQRTTASGTRASSGGQATRKATNRSTPQRRAKTSSSR
jgi:hypothetical protein